MASFGRRLAAALRRAAAFYTGSLRFALIATVGILIAGLFFASGPARFLYVVGIVVALGLITVAGSRAYSNRADVALSSEVGSSVHAEASSTGHGGPLVSVIVAAHNEARFVEVCINSIRAQTWALWECVVIDDASTDETRSLAFDAAAGEPRITIMGVDDAVGVSSARNLGIDHSSGEFMTFLDADDFLFARSLEMRATALLDRRGSSGVIGVYCDWAGVPENAEPSPEGRAPAAHDRISWFEAADGAPVISSAPLLLSSEVRRLGGFSDSWAEDADLWNRMLRNGYVLDPVAYNGVAYRQKAGSRFRTSARKHSHAMSELAASNRQKSGTPVVVEGAPHFYDREIDSYRMDLGVARRRMVGLATAHGNDDVASVNGLLTELQADWEPFLWLAIDVKQTIYRAAMRHQAYDNEGREERALHTTDMLMGHLAQLVPPPKVAATTSEVRTLTQGLSARPVRDRQRVEASSDEFARVVDNAVVLMPSVGYHVAEMEALAGELEGRGRRVVYAISDRRWPDVQAFLRSSEVPIVRCSEPGQWVSAAAGFVTLNDWGELYRDIVLAAGASGVPTFGKVEGVQDWQDVDVHWERRAYRTVDHVLCQGRNDEAALSSQSTFIVGSTRLEKIRALPPTERLDLVVLNSNFTYEVFGSVRDPWLDDAVAACQSAGVDHVVSMHPSERPIDRDHVAIDPMRHLLTKAGALISRFSTVPFEAMARGVPFVYFNPHGETVPTFAVPGGAFESAATEGELATALAKMCNQPTDYRAQSASFFNDQIDIDPDRTSATRSADVIESVCFP